MDRPDPPAGSPGTDVVVVGRVQAAYGVKGWVHLASFTDPPDNILEYSPWLIRARGAGNAWRVLDLLEVKHHKQGFVARPAGCDDRNAAEALKGSEIGVSAEALGDPGADEFYWRDLVGMAVRNSDGVLLGRVRQLIETAAHDVLVVSEEPDHRSAGERLIPFHRNYVLDVDPIARIIRVDWQENWQNS